MAITLNERADGWIEVADDGRVVFRTRDRKAAAHIVRSLAARSEDATIARRGEADQALPGAIGRLGRGQ